MSHEAEERFGATRKIQGDATCFRLFNLVPIVIVETPSPRQVCLRSPSSVIANGDEYGLISLSTLAGAIRAKFESFLTQLRRVLELM